MIDWLKPALEWLKTAPRYRYFVPIAVASALVLFLPEGFTKPLGLLPLQTEYRVYVGGTFLLSACIIGCNVIADLFTWGRNRYGDYQAQHNGIRRLEQLTPKEQKLPRPYLLRETRTQTFNVADGMESGTLTGLVNAKILYVAARQADMFAFPYNMHSWAWDYLNAHPELLDRPAVPSTRSLDI
jgi:hypothetical protein